MPSVATCCRSLSFAWLVAMLAGCARSSLLPGGTTSVHNEDAGIREDSGIDAGENDCSGPFAEGTPCNDGDPCTENDVCSHGACAGTAISCDVPPPPSCTSPKTLVTSFPGGRCVEGTCNFGATTEICRSWCDNGACAPPSVLGAGMSHACGAVYGAPLLCWGMNNNGELGVPHAKDYQPVVVTGLDAGVTAVAAGGTFTCALTGAFGVKCWGDDSRGALGDGSGGWTPTPVDAKGLSSGVVAIAAGFDHACALTSQGGVKCWGSNWGGALGTSVATQGPVDVEGLGASVIAITAGGAYTCALMETGGVKCWGYNAYGQLGNDSTNPSNVPVDVVGLNSGVVAIAAGDRHACAVSVAGAVSCWGSNSAGQLGQALQATEDYVPIEVPTLNSGVVDLCAGETHTCALMKSGSVECWGSNEHGELGNGTTSSVSTLPISVDGLPSPVVSVACGTSFTCAKTTSKAVMCWGSNYWGQLGDGTNIDRTSPQEVLGL